MARLFVSKGLMQNEFDRIHDMFPGMEQDTTYIDPHQLLFNFKASGKENDLDFFFVEFSSQELGQTGLTLAYVDSNTNELSPINIHGSVPQPIREIAQRDIDNRFNQIWDSIWERVHQTAYRELSLFKRLVLRFIGIDFILNHTSWIKMDSSGTGVLFVYNGFWINNKKYFKL